MEKREIKRVIITGGTGMIGQALVRYLLEQNVEVTVLVRKDSKRVQDLPKDKNVQIIDCALDKLSEIGEVLQGRYDVFYHLGWAGTFGEARNDMFLQNKNVEYTLQAVKLAHELGCSVFIGAGSQAEYGRVDGEKLTASLPVFPENGYGIAKLCAGQMSRILAQNYGMRHIWFRILSVYGPYDGEQTMIMSSVIKMLKGEIPEYTPAEQMWDYLYCEDAARAFYLAAQKGKDGAVYCLGSGEARPLREYIEMIRDVINPKIEIKFGTRPYADKQVMYLCADISDLQKDVGFKPYYTFDEGIEKTIGWYKEK